MVAAGPRLACLVAFFAVALGGPVGAPGAPRPRPALLRLRGGQEQAVLDEGEEAELRHCAPPAASRGARAQDRADGVAKPPDGEVAG